jgi:hypothetical protein
MFFSAKLFAMLVAIASIASSSAYTFNCRFVRFSWSVAGNRYTCLATSVAASGNSTHIVGVAGTHLSGMDNSLVEGLEVIDNKALTQMPKGIEEFFPNLVALRWMKGSLTSITAEDLQPFPSLIRLSFEENPLVTLDEDILSHASSLQSISFNSVGLRYVSPSFISGLATNSRILRYANFLNNTCIDTVANNNAQVLILQNSLEARCLIATTTPIPTTTPTPTTATATTSTTTEEVPDKCTGECAERIEVLETFLEEQLRLNKEYETRLLQLDRQIREINANPCLSC